jgi:hypothetical protein
MFIIWGKKRVTRRLGYVADFCPLCRDVRAFEVTRVGLAGHLYYISIGEGELAGYERTCAVCRTALNADPERYAQLGDLLLPPGELQPLTFPKLKEYWAARLAVERELKSVFGKLSPEDRSTLIREPFILLAPKVEQRLSSSLVLDKVVGISALIAFGALFVIAPLVTRLAPGSDGIVGFAFIAAIVAVLVQMLLAPGRVMRKEVLPVLAAALRPLKPAPAEIAAVLQEMKKAGRKIGSKVTTVDLMEALSGPQAEASSLPSAVRS